MTMSRNVCSKDFKLKIVEFIEQGHSQKEASEAFNLHKSVVSRLLKRYIARGSVNTVNRPGRPRKTSPRMDRSIIKCSKNDCFASGSEIKNILCLDVSSRTIQRRLREGGLFSCRPAEKPFINNKQKKARL